MTDTIQKIADDMQNWRSLPAWQVDQLHERLTALSARASAGEAEWKWKLVGTEIRPIEQEYEVGVMPKVPKPIEWETLYRWEATVSGITKNGKPPVAVAGSMHLRDDFDMQDAYTRGFNDGFTAAPQPAAAHPELPSAQGWLDSHCAVATTEWMRGWDAARSALAAAAPRPQSETLPDGGPPCNTHPDAPHGFNRNASHAADRYVCDCEGWMPPSRLEGAVAHGDGEVSEESLRAWRKMADEVHDRFFWMLSPDKHGNHMVSHESVRAVVNLCEEIEAGTPTYENQTTRPTTEAQEARDANWKWLGLLGALICEAKNADRSSAEHHAAIDKAHEALFGWLRAASIARPTPEARDAARLDFMQRKRVALIPEFEGPWDAEVYGEDGVASAIYSGNTPREAIDNAIAALALPAQGEG